MTTHISFRFPLECTNNRDCTEANKGICNMNNYTCGCNDGYVASDQQCVCRLYPKWPNINIDQKHKTHFYILNILCKKIDQKRKQLKREIATNGHSCKFMLSIMALVETKKNKTMSNLHCSNYSVSARDRLHFWQLWS